MLEPNIGNNAVLRREYATNRNTRNQIIKQAEKEETGTNLYHSITHEIIFEPL